MSDADDLLRPSRTSIVGSTLALLTASGTLVCCVLPAVMVALGAGAALAGLVGQFPQLVWLSAHKGLVFGTAGAMLALAGSLLWWARREPCPVDPVLGRACMRLRTLSAVLFGAAVVCYFVGAFFAFVLPTLSGSAA